MVRKAPSIAAPKPEPATAVPARRVGADAVSIAARVTAVPVSRKRQPASLMTGRDNDRVDVGHAVEEAVGAVDSGEGRDGAVWGMAAHAGDGHIEGSEPAGDPDADGPGADDAG